MASKVFIIQDDGRRDFRPAEQWGELIPLLSKDAHPDDAEERAAKMQRIIHNKLFSNDYDPDRDFILLTGDPVAIVAMGLYIGTSFESKYTIRVLKYDRETNSYYPIRMQIEILR
jgi:hypothetical protein